MGHKPRTFTTLKSHLQPIKARNNLLMQNQQTRLNKGGWPKPDRAAT